MRICTNRRAGHFTGRSGRKKNLGITEFSDFDLGDLLDLGESIAGSDLLFFRRVLLSIHR
jgi:hypothetical protein